ncbi:MAG: PAS domain S-box protein [Gammaproteobacteria bacterium]|nr:PAS domain S-box protein [Gammaproteobacteria bacterium]
MAGESVIGDGLLQRVGAEDASSDAERGESAWIEVIHKMDQVYADLVHYQVELEEKNSALEEAQHFIENVQTSMTDVLIVCDINGDIKQANRALQQLTGCAAEELVGRPFSALFESDSRQLVAQFAEKIRSETVYDCEVNLLGSDGAPTPLAMNCNSLFDHEGKLVGMVLIGRPVGELRRAYEALHRTHNELQQAQRQLVHSEKMASLGRLVAGVAHELNNPISFVFGNMHALKGYGERIKRYLEALHGGDDPAACATLREELRIDRILGDIGSLIDGTLEGAERVSNIVQDLRRFSGNQQQQQQVFELCPLVRTAVDWVIKAARDKPRVELRLDESLSVEGNNGSTHQILVNLLQNAVDVLEDRDDPRLCVCCRREAERVLVEVSDNGPGIPQSDLLRVFDPFFTTKEVGKGTGLGLYISYGLATDQGGDLQAVNLPAGGARFVLSMKAA